MFGTHDPVSSQLTLMGKQAILQKTSFSLQSETAKLLFFLYVLKCLLKIHYGLIEILLSKPLLEVFFFSKLTQAK